MYSNLHGGKKKAAWQSSTVPICCARQLSCANFCVKLCVRLRLKRLLRQSSQSKMSGAHTHSPQSVQFPVKISQWRRNASE